MFAAAHLHRFIADASAAAATDVTVSSGSASGVAIAVLRAGVARCEAEFCAASNAAWRGGVHGASIPPGTKLAYVRARARARMQRKANLHTPLYARRYAGTTATVVLHSISAPTPVLVVANLGDGRVVVRAPRACARLAVPRCASDALPRLVAESSLRTARAGLTPAK